MKTFITYLFLALFLVACGEEHNLRVSGTVEAGLADGDSIYIVNIALNGSVQTLASSVVQNGSFELEAMAELPAVCYIVTYNKQGMVQRNIDIIADGSPLNVRVLENYARVTGSPLNDELQNYKDSVEVVKTLYKQYYKKKELNPTLSEKAKEEADKVMQVTALSHSNIVCSTIERNIDNIVGYHVLKNNFDILDAARGAYFIERLPEQYKSDYLITYMSKFYKANEKYSVGSQFSDFVLPDSEGKDHYLSAYMGNGKPVIVSFWLSGSKLSLTEQAVLKEFDDKHKGDFSFVTISLDTNRREWLSAMEKHSFAGVQLSDFRGWNTAPLSIYGIDSCPYYILIDKRGVISYRGQSIEEMFLAAEQLRGK